MSVKDTARTARAVLDITAGLENSTAMALDVPLAVDVAVDGAVEEADAVAVTLEVEVEDDVEVELELDVEVAVGVVDGTWLCKNTALMSWAADTMSAKPAQRGAGAMQQ